MAGIEYQLARIAEALESLIEKPQIKVEDFDPDELSSVSYSDESKELIQQHLDKRIGGFVVRK